MTEQLYTEVDLDLAAMLQLRQLVADHSPLDVGSRMEHDYIRMVEDPETGGFQPALGSDRWGELPESEFDEARHRIHGRIAGAADLSPWAVAMGADELEPSTHVIDLRTGDGIRARIHFAFGPDMPEDAPRRMLVTLVGEAIRDAVVDPADTASDTSGEVLELRADLADARRDYLNACRTIAEMHAAAVGELRGPGRGVVEDVADVRAELTAAYRAIRSLPYDTWMQLDPAMRRAANTHVASTPGGQG